MSSRNRFRAIGLAVAALLCAVAPAGAQVQAGSEVLLNLDGSVSTGYSGSVTNQGPDSHGLIFGGTGNFTGSVHSPQFLSFDVAPFFNQSRDNSDYQSITNSSGVTASATIFGGSQFPGYISFSKVYNSESNYAVPGLANYATNGNSEALGVGWTANLKNLPTLTFGYQQGSNDYTLYGTQQDSTSDFHSFFGNAAYTVDGFHLSGGIHYSDASSLFPEVVTGQPNEKVTSDNTTLTFNMGRSIALNGSTWLNFTRNTGEYDSPGISNSQTADIVTGGVSLKPTSKLNVQFNADYNDNLAGTVFQAVAATGTIAPLSLTEAPSHSWGFSGEAQYSLFAGLYVAGTASRREQLFLGTNFDSTAFGGSVNYGHNLLGGQFTAGVNVTHNSYGGNYGASMLGLLSDVIYIRRFGAWSVSSSFNYSRDAETQLIAYSTSGYGYSTSVSRRIGRLTWTGSANGAKSLLNEVQGANTFTQAYTVGLSGRWLGASAGYSRSSGIGLITPAGITPLPPGLPPTLGLTPVSYAGTTYSAGVGSSPIRGLTINGSFVQAQSNTANGPLASNNKTQQAYAYVNYRFRKVYFNSGYSRLLQGFTASGLAPTMVSTYYVGVSRWFKAF